jgi:hypothetical protein
MRFYVQCQYCSRETILSCFTREELSKYVCPTCSHTKFNTKPVDKFNVFGYPEEEEEYSYNDGGGD